MKSIAQDLITASELKARGHHAADAMLRNAHGRFAKVVRVLGPEYPQIVLGDKYQHLLHAIGRAG